SSPTSGKRARSAAGGGPASASVASTPAVAAYSLAMMMSRLETSSSEEINERRRQMSACRRKYAALGMAGRPQVFFCNAGAAVRFPTNGAGGGPFRADSQPPSHCPGPTFNETQGQWRRGVSIPFLPDAPGLFGRPPHLARLAVAGAKRLQARLEQGIFLVVLERDSLDAFLFLEVRQLDAFRHVRVADDRLRIATLGDGVEIVEQALADHHNSEVARADVFLAAVGDRALTDPGDDVLVDDVARDPAAVLVLNRAHPGRNGVLHVGFASLRHAHEEPRNAERVLVVDRHAPFEMIAEVEAVRPQRDAAHGPIRIALVGVLAHPLVDEAVVEFLELELEVLAGIGTGLAAQPQAPIVVHPLEVHGVAGVLLALEPIAGNVGEHDFAKAVLPRERLPHRQLRHRLRPHIGP